MSNEPRKNLSAKNPGGKGTRHRQPAVTDEAREVFLASLRKGYTVTHSAEDCGVSHSRRLYELRDADPEFRLAWDEAWQAGNDALIEEARRRAVEGWDEPIASAGKIVGSKRVYDSRLLERLLAARMPAFRNQPQTTLNVSTGAEGARVTLQQHGVTMEAVAEVLAKAGALKQFGIEAPTDLAEIVAESDEPA